MQRNQFIFDGLDRIDQVIKHLESEVAYFTLRDRNLSGKDGYIGRLDFEPKDVVPYIQPYSADSRPPSSRVSPYRSSAASAQELEELDAEALMDDDSPPDDDPPLDDDSPSDEDAPDDGDERPEDSLHAGMLPLTAELDRRTMLEGVCNWVRRFACAHVQTIEAAHIMLRAYGPKGTKVIISCSFLVRNRLYNRTLAQQALRGANELTAQQPVARAGHEPDVNAAPGGAAASAQAPTGSLAPYPAHALAAVPPSQPAYLPPPGMLLYPAHFQDGTLFGTQGAFRALNESYESFGRTMVGGINQIQTMMGQVLQDMGHELHSARSQVNHLVDSVLDHRVQQVEAQSQVQETTHLADQRTALARDAIQQIGEAAKAFLLSRGLSVESAELVSTLSSHPELMATLQAPEVQELLSDPRNLDVLARSLRQVGQQNQALKAASQQGAPGAASPAQIPAGQSALPGATGPYTWPGGVQPALPAGGTGYPAVQVSDGNGYPASPSVGGAGYPAAMAAGSGFPAGQSAQVAVSPGLAARAAARSLYNSSLPPGYPGAAQAPMAPAPPWPGPGQYHPQGPFSPGFPSGGQVSPGSMPYPPQGPVHPGWPGGPGSPVHPGWSGGPGSPVHPGSQPLGGQAISPSGAVPPSPHYPPPADPHSWSPHTQQSGPSAPSWAPAQSTLSQTAAPPGSRLADPDGAHPPPRPVTATETRSRLPSSANVDPSARVKGTAGGQDSVPVSSPP